MALVVCAECGKPVSDKASACPNCGNPIGKGSSSPQLIERTSKEWKIIRIISGVLMFFAIIIILSGVGAHNNEVTGFGGILFLFGLAGSIVSKFGAYLTTG